MGASDCALSSDPVRVDHLIGKLFLILTLRICVGRIFCLFRICMSVETGQFAFTEAKIIIASESSTH